VERSGAAEPGAVTRRLTLSTALRVLVSLALLAGLVYFAHRTHAWDALRRADLVMVAGGFCCYLTGQLIAARRWYLLLLHSGFQPRFREVLRANTIGVYAGNFVPGVAGGDLFRPILLFGPKTTKKPQLYASVLFERLGGLVATLLLASVGAAWFALTHRDLHFVTVAGFVLLLIVALLAAAYAIRHVHLAALPRINAWLDHVREGSHHLLRYVGSPKSVLMVLLYSLAFQACNIGMLWCFLDSLDPIPSPFAVVLAAPLAWLASMAPVSLNGLGVREGTLMVVLTQLGLPQAQVAGAALLGLLPLLLVSSLGALWSLALFDRN